MATQLARQCARTLSGRHPTAFDGAAADASDGGVGERPTSACRESGAAACAAARVACSSRQRNAARRVRRAVRCVSRGVRARLPVDAAHAAASRLRRDRARHPDSFAASDAGGEPATAATKRSATASAAAEMTSPRASSAAIESVPRIAHSDSATTSRGSETSATRGTKIEPATA